MPNIIIFITKTDKSQYVNFVCYNLFMKNTKTLTASFEKYLCAIYEIQNINEAARVKDIAEFLSIGAPSVSEAMKALDKKGCINYEPYGKITLTESGKQIVEEKLKRSEIIFNFLKDVLLVDETIIEKNAQTIEYAMDEAVLEKFVSFLTFMQTCSCKEPKWIKSFKHYATQKKLQDKCLSCIEKSKNSSVASDRPCSCS